MHVVIFEGSRWDTFAPFSLTRPMFLLRSGTGTLLDKQLRHLKPTRLTLWVRPAFERMCRERVAPKTGVPTSVNVPLDGEPALLVGGRTLMMQRFEMPEDEMVVLDTHKQDDDDQRNEYVRQAFVRGRPGLSVDDVMTRSDAWMKLFDLPRGVDQARWTDHMWDLVAWNEESLLNDSILLGPAAPLAAGPYHAVDEEHVFLGENVELSPGVVLDATRGPVVLGDGVRVGANSVLQGPCFVGAYSHVSPLTSIGPGTSIGPVCKIGGSVNNSIVGSYTNKVYEGFLGESIVGDWVNIGAGSTTADVKTTYGLVSMKIGGRELATGRRTLGSFVGDHAKLSINTRLTPGCYVGVSSLLAGEFLVPKFVPSFSFWHHDGTHGYSVDKACEVAGRMMARRDQTFGAVDEAAMRYAAEAAGEVER